MLRIGTAKYLVGIVIRIGGVIVRRAFLLGFLFLALSTIHAFPLVFDNYKLTSVAPKGRIISDRSYEDKTIRIEFGDFTGNYPEFTLKNISSKPLTIIWDLCAYVDDTGRSQRVLKIDIRYIDIGKSIPPTLLIPGAYVNEAIAPVDSVEFGSEWIVHNPIPREANQKISIVLTVEQQGEQETYIFTFESIMETRLVLVENGTFVMGDTWGDGWGNEEPSHKVTLTYDFYIGKYETTFDEYDAFCETTDRSKPNDEDWGRGCRPVINVSWWDAVNYCNWLSEKEKLPKAYDSEGNLLDKYGSVTTDPSEVIGYRLPTEAEWEYAARGGNKSEGYKYSGSDNADEVAWYFRNSGDNYLIGNWDWISNTTNNNKSQEVGTKLPNELEIFDMSGNADEWCSDWWDSSYYSISSTTNPYNYSVEDFRVYRGGNINDDEASVRSVNRNSFLPTFTSANLGFRICRAIPSEGENRHPYEPYNPVPSNNMKKWTTNISLIWDCMDSDGDDVRYDVYFGSSIDTMIRVATGQTEKIVTNIDLTYDKTYYWKVIAKDSWGAATEGPVWEFSTIEELPVPLLVLVERGSFAMGDDIGDLLDFCAPSHKVTLNYDYYVSKYETTFDEFDAFCDINERDKLDDEGWGRGHRPVINVSWNDAIDYCNWLSEKEKLPKAYDENGDLLDKDGNVTTDITKVLGYRLPTEAEWEYAARGGNRSEGYKYSGSDNIDDVAWYLENSRGKTQGVGKKEPNELGLYDMSGNVWEWCSDWYIVYYDTSQINPYNGTVSCFRVYRGGSWVNWWGKGYKDARIANRYANPPDYTNNDLGFRVCRTVPERE